MPRGATPNRTDLAVPGPVGPPPGQGQPNGQPIQVPTGLPYGENQQLQQAQQAAPLPQAPQVPQGGPVPQGSPGQPGPQAPTMGFDMAGAMQAAKQMVPPKLGSLTRPTERPNEPVTAGLPGSPVSPAPQRQTGNLSSMIAAVAQSSNSAALSQLAARAASAGQ